MLDPVFGGESDIAIDVMRASPGLNFPRPVAAQYLGIGSRCPTPGNRRIRIFILLGFIRRRQFSKAFDDIRQINRLFFRNGDNASKVAELSESQLKLFAQYHRDYHPGRSNEASLALGYGLVVSRFRRTWWVRPQADDSLLSHFDGVGVELLG